MQSDGSSDAGPLPETNSEAIPELIDRLDKMELPGSDGSEQKTMNSTLDQNMMTRTS